jgi:uncharacterized RDD family membrane protein YckC
METTTSAALSTTNYAGFGQRLIALIIDGIIIGMIQAFIITPILAVVGIGIASDVQNADSMSEAEQLGMIGSLMATMGTVILVVYAIQILYFSIMESSKFQGSVGKMALGLKVVDMNGNPISFGTAFLRSIGKIISGAVMCIGYLMAAFTDKKQALHDMIASTLVVKK